jgi:predicted DNA-binding transcriptional regulator YafY
MSETASTQLNRIVTVVAELSRLDAAGKRAPALGEVAARHGTTPEQLRRDLRTLTEVGGDSEADWLESLSVWQQGDRISVASRGPFRRPLRFTSDELLAVQIGLATENAKRSALSAQLAGALHVGEENVLPYHVASAVGAGEAQVVDLAREALEERRVLSILYTGERDRAGTARQVEPHQIVCAGERYYVVAWCRKSEGWREFRADRVLDAALENEVFQPRADFVPLGEGESPFRAPADALDEVRVRFSPDIARWLEERYPDAERQADGSVVVTYCVADPSWFVRHILQYGPDAEVLSPAEYREAVWRAVGRVAS